LEKIEMKKTLVAVAAITAVTGAMAQATISGQIEMGYTSATTSTAGAVATTKSLGDGHGNNVLNFNAADDLGGGMKADIQFGFAPISDANNSAIKSYQSFVGLSGDFGRVQGGAFTQSQANIAFNYDLMGAWGLSVANFAAANTGFFMSNQLKYSLPAVVKGLTADYTKGFGETTGSKIGDSSTYAIGYKTGGFSGDYAYTSMASSTTVTMIASNVGLSYDFGMAKASVMIASQKNGSNTTVTGSSYGISVPFGAAAIAVQQSNATAYTASTTAAPTAVAQSALDWKVSYALSKRTNVYGMYGSASGYGTAAATANSNKKTQLFVIHSF
jgi:predicted porin